MRALNILGPEVTIGSIPDNISNSILTRLSCGGSGTATVTQKSVQTLIPVLPIAYYAFDSDAQLTADSTGNGKTLTIDFYPGEVYYEESPTISGGSIHNVGLYDRSVAYCDNLIQLESIFSISFWINITNNNPFDSQIYFLSDGTHQQLSIYQRNYDNQVIFGTYNYDTYTQTEIIIPTSYSSPGWHHVVGTVNGADRKFYLDGILVGSDTLSVPLNLFGNSIQLTGSKFGYPMCGNIDEVSLWPIVLTDANVTRLYNNGNGLNYNDTISMPGDIKPKSFTMLPLTSTYIRKEATDTLESTSEVYCTPVGFF